MPDAGAIPPALVEALETLLTDDAMYGARVGVHVVDQDLRVLVSHGADKGFLPASNMKLYSSSAALRTLGPKHRFETRLMGGGEIKDGVLSGDVVLVGSGDPTLGAGENALAPFEAMAAALQEAGIKTIEGRIVADDSIFDDEIMGRGWQWDYQSDDYAAQLSGLCFHHNVVEITLEGTEVGKLPKFTIYPQVGHVRLASAIECGAAGTKNSLIVRRDRATNTIHVDGQLAVDAKDVKVAATVENPTIFAARALAQVLKEAGIKTGPAVDLDSLGSIPGDPADRRVLASALSAPLAEIVMTLNKRSQNLYAEQIVRAAAVKAGHPGNGEGAAALVAATLREFGIEPRGAVFADGSGLSRRNFVQPQQTIGLLRMMADDEHGAFFFSTLPVAGEDGTLSSRFKGTPAAGHVRAKTGFISYVAALSGKIERPGEGAAPFYFSVMLNQFTCSPTEAKRVIDAFVVALARHAGWGQEGASGG